MISLDKNILNKDSVVVRRMFEYGKKNELFIIIPSYGKESLVISQTVHTESTGGNKLLQFFRLMSIGKKLIKENDIQEITTQDPFFTGLVGWLLKRKLGIKLEVQVHGDFFNGYYKKQWLKLCLAKFILKRADKIRVVGERIKQNLIKFNKIDENKIEVRPVVVDVEKIRNYQPKVDLRQKYPGYEKIFLVLGRLDPVKNIEWLVDIFVEVVRQKNKYLLLVVGGGIEEPRLKLQVASYKLQSNIHFALWTDDPISYLKAADCLLFPSLSEGYGLVAMEAQAAGCPVIMNDVGVANYELKLSEKADPRTVPLESGSSAWVKILPINDKEAWIKAILEVYREI